MRTIDDALEVAQYIRERRCRRAVVVGGGLLGLEAAFSIGQAGVRVAVVEAAPWPLARQLDRAAGALVLELMADLGVKIHPGAAARALHGADAVVVDCVTVWVANLMLRGDGDEAILTAADAVAALLPACAFDVTLVSNEVGEGVHPETEAGLRFRDLLGSVNQRLAAACDRVVLMVAGLPLALKAPSARIDAVEAP